jgi:hypothetical protein
VCAVCAALLLGISEGRAVCAVERGVVVGWLVGCASLPALCLAVTPGKRPIKPPLERVQRGTEWGCLPVSVCASLGEEEQKVLQCCAILEIRGIAEDDYSHCVCYVLV